MIIHDDNQILTFDAGRFWSVRDADGHDDGHASPAVDR